MGDAQPVAAAPKHPISLARLAAEARRQRPRDAVQSISIVTDEPDRAYIGMAPPGPSKFIDGKLMILDRGTGKPLPFNDPDFSFTAFC